jgi:hypothetical protein
MNVVADPDRLMRAGAKGKRRAFTQPAFSLDTDEFDSV